MDFGILNFGRAGIMHLWVKFKVNCFWLPAVARREVLQMEGHGTKTPGGVCFASKGFSFHPFFPDCNREIDLVLYYIYVPDLLCALKRAKSGRSPGPVMLPVETLELLPYFLKRSLLDYYNHCYASSTAPTHWTLSKVVMLYKRNNKDSRSPSSYRPLSLANSIYKVYASMIQSRLAYYLDHRLQPQQFGFRSGRSLSTPLFILRRLTELFERHSSSLYILFLDWSQASDSVTHSALRASLLRYGVPEQTVSSIMALYHEGQFYVQDQFSTSSTRSIGRGIRQGCPLSPYLFVIVLSALTHDLHVIFQALFGFSPWTHSANLHLTDVEYAADTVLVSCTNITLMCRLHLLQYLALRIGLSLNPSKCQLLAIHGNLPVSLSRLSRPVLASIVPLPLPIQLVSRHYCHLLSHYVLPNALVLLLHPYPLLLLISFTVALRLPQPSNSLNLFSDTHLFPNVRSFVLMLPLSNPSCYMVWNLKPFPQLRSQKLILFILRLSDRSFKSKVHITTVFCNRPILIVPTNTFKLFVAKCYQLLFPILFEFPTYVLYT